MGGDRGPGSPSPSSGAASQDGSGALLPQEEKEDALHGLADGTRLNAQLHDEFLVDDYVLELVSEEFRGIS